MSDTICAVATAPGVGGVALIRVSGSEARGIVDQIFHCRQLATLERAKDRCAYFGRIIHEGKFLDEVLVTCFYAPHSYTGEDVVEIACHGSLYIQQALLEALTDQGCRMAEPGEYTRRAYLNGKMDLSRAEAVADLIASESAAQHRMALTQMRGGYSREFAQLRERLIQLTALMELELDFSEEDVTFADRSELLSLSQELETKIQSLVESFRLGNAIKKGIPVALAGATNVGKSTLLNALLGEERAIVSDIHGTTRDTVEEVMNVDGLLFRFIDTAGLRHTADQIEALGIERSYARIDEASLILLVLDASRLLPALTPTASQHLSSSRLASPGDRADELKAPAETKDKGCPSQLQQPYALEPQEPADYLIEVQQLRQRLDPARLIVLLNKVDLLAPAELDQLLSQLPELLELSTDIPVLPLAARTGSGLPELRKALVTRLALPELSPSSLVVSNARHHALLKQAAAQLALVRQGLAEGLPTDLLAPDLRLAISALGEVTGGEITSDTVLHHIFAHFCIGK
nr:tRNA uridine-5-carboxymethylaminomethyl(34) synthesis GTPase MnmE [uncultured Porphyromonas sp.]